MKNKNNTLFILMIFLLLTGILTGSSAKIHSIKIVAIGDSITYGTGDPLRIGYIGRFQQQFEQDKRCTIQISNFGVPKYDTEDILIQLKENKMNKNIHDANFIILFVGTNDFRKSAGYRFDSINLKKLNDGKKEFSTNLYQILKKFRKDNASAPIIVMGLYHPYTELKNNKQLLGLINEWNTEITEVAAQYESVIYVPTLDLFINQPKITYFSDSLHPNRAGYQLIANRLFEKMIVFDINGTYQ